MYQTWSIKRLAWFHMMKNQHLPTRHLTPKLKLNLKLTFLSLLESAAAELCSNGQSTQIRKSEESSGTRARHPLTDFQIRWLLPAHATKILKRVGFRVLWLILLQMAFDTREREVIGKPLQFETFLGVAISQSINSLKTRDQVSFFIPSSRLG